MNNINKKELEEMCNHISNREQLSAKAQRDSIKYKQAEYLQDKIGKVFDGIISSITEWGIYVELIDNKCEGMIKYNSLESKYTIDIEKYMAYNNIGDIIRLGDNIKVIILSVDLERKQVDFKKF